MNGLVYPITILCFEAVLVIAGTKWQASALHLQGIHEEFSYQLCTEYSLYACIQQLSLNNLHIYMEFMDYGILYTYTLYENKKMDAPFGFKTN